MINIPERATMINIPERAMWEGEDSNFGKTVQGYLYRYQRDDNGKMQYCLLNDTDAWFQDMDIKYIIPETLQPVRVKPEWLPASVGMARYLGGFPHCPNCNEMLEPFVSYCSDCGMALDWTEEAQNV